MSIKTKLTFISLFWPFLIITSTDGIAQQGSIEELNEAKKEMKIFLNALNDYAADPSDVKSQILIKDMASHPLKYDKDFIPNTFPESKNDECRIDDTAYTLNEFLEVIKCFDGKVKFQCFRGQYSYYPSFGRATYFLMEFFLHTYVKIANQSRSIKILLLHYMGNFEFI
jgi:hypothetical protein